MKNVRTIILAAGKGTRMHSQTPKILHQVCGQPLIDYVLNLAFKVGSLKNCVVLGHQHNIVEAYLKERYPASKNISTVLQKKLLGTADAVKSAAAQFRGYRGHVLIMCGDTPLLREDTLRALIRKHKKSEAACTFLTAVLQEPKGYGRIIRGPDGSAVAIREETDATDYEKNIAEINVGLYCFKSDALFSALNQVALNPVKKEFYLTDIIELFADRRVKIETIETPEPQEGLGVNSRQDLAVADTAIRRRTLRDLMRQGVTIIDPATTFIDADVRIGKDTVIRPFTFIERDVRIGARCTIGPFARLRPGVRLADEVEIGNFTEVSRSQIGSRSIMKHFSFLGDARVGRQVNIGAGTVTANYDGTSKNVTRIADGAFIGSDSILVAPVNIGRKSVTGAGSVVKKGTSVPDGKIAVGVPARIIKKTRQS